jgi:cysteine desulfurase
MKWATKRIYADAGAATPLSNSVKKEVFRLMELFGNPSALHKEALQAKEEFERARASVARSLGAHADEIVFTGSGTEANNLAIQGVLRPFLKNGDQVHAITSVIEHPSVLEPLRALIPEGLLLTELPVDSEGFVSIKDLKESITEKTVFVSIQMVNSEIGTIQDIREIAKEIRHVRRSRETVHIAPSDSLIARGQSRVHSSPTVPLYLHTDASQAPLWLPLAVEKLGIDLLTIDAQKMMGPKGVGVLYIKRGVDLEPILWGGGQEGGKRSGTENLPLAGGLALALEEAGQATEARAKKVADVRDELWKEIKTLLPEAIVNGPERERRVANNLNVSIPNLNGEMAVIALDREGIAASTRSACDSEDEEPSHVLKALGVSTDFAKSTIRVTFLPDATLSDARTIAKTLKTLAQRYLRML